MKNKILRYIIIVIPFLVAGCLSFGDKLVLINEKDIAVKNVQVKVAEEIVWKGNLEPAAIITIRYTAVKDGAIEIEGIVDHKPIKSGPLGYVTKNGGSLQTITIRQNNSFDLSVK